MGLQYVLCVLQPVLLVMFTFVIVCDYIYNISYYIFILCIFFFQKNIKNEGVLHYTNIYLHIHLINWRQRGCFMNSYIVVLQQYSIQKIAVLSCQTFCLLQCTILFILFFFIPKYILLLLLERRKLHIGPSASLNFRSWIRKTFLLFIILKTFKECTV